jgi:hypothetical protein
MVGRVARRPKGRTRDPSPSPSPWRETRLRTPLNVPPGGGTEQPDVHGLRGTGTKTTALPARVSSRQGGH